MKLEFEAFRAIILCWICASNTNAFEVVFQSFHREVDLDVFWLNTVNMEEVHVGTIRPGKQVRLVDVDEGHVFTIRNPLDGTQIVRTALERSPYFLLHPQSDRGGFVRVQCTLKNKNLLNIDVHPKWSPRGAGRFLEMVESDFFTGVALSRVIPAFLTQFGISPRGVVPESIKDDVPSKHTPNFKPGTLSFAGNGPDSRTSEVFIVMPETPQFQLKAFGMNPWETPFGRLSDVSSQVTLTKLRSYGDMPPFGNGVSHSRMYREGYSFLKREYPDLDYLQECHIVDDFNEPEL
jgi:peptidyl-prolyl cis-trans isomerase A (cyclophilin A)